MRPHQLNALSGQVYPATPEDCKQTNLSRILLQSSGTLYPTVAILGVFSPFIVIALTSFLPAIQPLPPNGPAKAIDASVQLVSISLFTKTLSFRFL